MASFLLLLLLSLPSISAITDTEALTIFLRRAAPHGILSPNWTASASACSVPWRGVSCSRGRVTSLILPSLDLRGSLLPLSHLRRLRLLDLHQNRLNGTLSPLLPSLPHLKFLFLAGNLLSGQIPAGISPLSRLLRIDLSHNHLHGSIPDLAALPPNLAQLDLSHNHLSGRVSDGLIQKFGPAALAGNAGLCGPPAQNLLPPCNFAPPAPSNPSSISAKRLSAGAVVSIVMANIAFISVLCFLMCAYCCCAAQRNEKDGKVEAEEAEKEGKARKSDDGSETEARSGLVLLERKGRGFELEELLRASAEMLGKGSVGSVYRAVLGDGEMVAVKRVKDGNPCCFRDFDKYMNLIGGLFHANVVPLRAYYYAKQEKLLVYDYLPNGTLFSLLHGNRETGRVPLDWTTRLSLVLGAARGLSHIHEEYISSKIPHGNIKTSNILLTKNGKACVSDFGLALLLNPATAVARLGGYAAPEQAQSRKLSQEADVYAFGVLLLEVLTGRTSGGGGGVNLNLPDWVRSVVREEWTAEVFDAELMRYKNIEEEMVALLHVALACVARRPENRPVMAEVVRMIQEIRVERSPLAGDDDDDELNESRRASASPSLPSTATEDGRYSCALTE